MKKGLLICMVALFGFAGSAFAGLPCAAYSSCDLTLDISEGCTTTDLVWTPAGTADVIVISVTVRDCLENPVDTCQVRLDMSGSIDVHTSCGTNITGVICGSASSFATTDANGVAEFTVTGGGGGALFLDWTVTALCADPEVELCTSSDTLCVKSHDVNGSGNINFFDTFKYLPALNAGISYCVDWGSCNTANTVNFFDTFKYLPHLNAADACPSGFFALTVVDGVIECDDLF